MSIPSNDDSAVPVAVPDRPPNDRHEALKVIAAQARRGELVFPTSVSAALRIRRALDQPDCSVATAARLIQTEPLLSARVVALANSVAFNRSGQAITDVGSAVARLGFRTVHTLAQALIARQMAGAPANPAHRELAVRLWQHTALVAALARVIARRVTRQDPETALFTGLVHEVRGFYLISRAGEFPHLVDLDIDPDQDDAAETAIGVAVLDMLEVPAAVAEAIRTVWTGYLELPPSTLADTVLLAKQLAPIGSPLFGDVDADSALRASIDVAFGDETLTEILEESADEVDSMAKALQF